MWCAQLDTLLQWEPDRSFAGQHVVVSETLLCDGTLLLAYAMQRYPRAHFVALFESPLHYQTVGRKLGCKGLELTFYTALDALPANLDGECVIVDTLYPLQCVADSPLDVVDQIQALRKRLGKTGVLWTRMQEQCLEPRWIAYESDLMLTVREVEANDVTGRISVTERDQQQANEVLFTVAGDAVTLKRV